MIKINMLTHFAGFMIDAVLHTYSEGARDARGYWVSGAEQEETITISQLVPVAGKQLEMMPEGEKVSDYRLTYVNTSVGLKTREGDNDADMLTVDGVLYEVHRQTGFDAWSDFDEYLIKKVDDE
jgi:hypothetical protein